MKSLSQLQPPSSWPLLNLLRHMQPTLQQQAEKFAADNNLEAASACYEESICFDMAIRIAYTVGNENSIFCEGHPERAVQLGRLSSKVLASMERLSPFSVEPQSHTSRYLDNIPSTPPFEESRRAAGVNMMVEAIKEYQTAGGKDEQGGEKVEELYRILEKFNISKVDVQRAIEIPTPISP
jgi:hypothetical protein